MSTAEDVYRSWRLRAQFLQPRYSGIAEHVVRHLAAIQAQDAAWAKWSIGSRSVDTTRERVDWSIKKHRIVRTWLFRGTLHYCTAEDVHWITSVIAPTIIKRNARRYRRLELDELTFRDSTRVIGEAISRRGPLTRGEIVEALGHAGISAEGQRAPYLLQRASLDGLLCHGIERDGVPTFVLRSEWIGPETEELPREEACRRLLLRYLGGHAPATKQDFAWWSGLPAAEISQARAAADDRLSTVRYSGHEYWFSSAAGDEVIGTVTAPYFGLEDSGTADRDRNTESESPNRRTNQHPVTPAGAKPGIPSIAHFLPPFDEYLLGYRDRSLILAPERVRAVNSGGGMPKPTVALDGAVIGTFRYRRGGSAMGLNVTPFRTMSGTEHTLLREAADRLSHFLAQPVDVDVTEPSA